jgi:hypothetical protein
MELKIKQNLFYLLLALFFMNLTCYCLGPGRLAWGATTTPITITQLTEIRNAVDAKRAALGLAPHDWMDPQPVLIRRAYIAEIQAAINELTAYSYNAPPFISPPSGLLRVSQISALRKLVTEPYSLVNPTAISFCGDYRCDSDIISSKCGGFACEACIGPGNLRQCLDCGVCPFGK